MANTLEQETLRMRAKDLSSTISKGEFTSLEGKRANEMLNNRPKFGTVTYTGNRLTTFQPVTSSNQLPPVAPVDVPRGTDNKRR